MSNADTLDPGMILTDAIAEMPLRGASTAAPPDLLLRLVGGLHAGGVHALRDRQSLLVGSDAACDIVLSDAGVEPQHCELARHGRKLTLRSITGSVAMADGPLEPGSLRAVRPQTAIAIGDAVLMISTAQELARAAQPAGDPDSPPVSATGIGSRVALAAGLLLALTLLIYALAGGDGTRGSAGTPEQWLTQASAVIDQLALAETSAKIGDDAALEVTGVVPDADAERKLVATLSERQLPAEVAVRTGTQIADDVRELLRLNGIDARTRYLGDGRVEAWGAFGDDRSLNQAVDSRAMSEVDGLRQVLAHNTHRKPAAAPPPSNSAKQVRYVVAGADPYVVTEDGSRYYVGARLPGGDVLVGIAERELRLRRNGQIEQRPATGYRLDAGSTAEAG